MTTDKKIVVRMAPSPTGNLHVGTARTTLFNYLFAKKFGGKFIMRIEDTDKERSTKEYEKDILEGLEWLGLSWDEFYRQSERTEVYVSYVKKMIENGSAYISKEEVKEVGQRSEVVRFKNPNKKLVFEDLIRGPIEFDTTELGDFVIAKSESEPLYHLAVVVDDHEMGVTHVIRGEDHISNTPRQILIQEGIGAIRPQYAHLPLFFDTERKKISKRKHGESVGISYYKKEGYLPEAILNFLAFLGWNPGDEREIFTLNELVEAFDMKGVQKGGAIFNVEKLRWVNREHIKRMPREELVGLIKKSIENKFPDKNIPDGIYDLIIDRTEILSDIDRLIEEGEVDYVFMDPVLDIEKIIWKNDTKEGGKKHLEKVLDILKQSNFVDKETASYAVLPYAEAEGKGNVLWPLRYALSGKEKSPDPFTLLGLLGKEESLRRIEAGIIALSE
jgi:glutamyl-tRNA synthetase